MSRFTSLRRTSLGIATAALSVALVFAVIALVVTAAPSSRAPLEAVIRIEGLGCKRKPTRTVGTVVSGPFALSGQLVLTVAHGVVGQQTIELVSGSVRVPARLVAVDADWDLALLHAAVPLLKNDGTPVAGVRFSQARIGNATFVVFEESSDTSRAAFGTSDAESVPPEIAVARPAFVSRRLRIRTEDIYLREVETRDARPGLEVQAMAFVGDSGGPMFDVNGEMVGLVWGTSRKSSGRSWATRVQAAGSLIDTATVALTDNGNASFESLGLLACAP